MGNKKTSIVISSLSMLVVVLTIALFGMYVHFTNQNMSIGSNNPEQAKNSQNNSSDNNAVDNIKNNNNTSSNSSSSTGNNENVSNNNSPGNDNASTNLNDNTQSTANETSNGQSTEVSNLSSDITYIDYTVLVGDTLTSIWQKNIVCYTFNNAKDIIITKNNLNTTGDLKPGEKIKIPYKDTKGYIKYTVKKGDALITIAEKYMANKKLKDAVDAITKINGEENVEYLQVGQVLLIPST